VNYVQRALRFNCDGNCLVGIADVPERPIERGLLIISDAAQYRVGAHRQVALLARMLAPHGIPVMRFDQRGCGDSEGSERGFDEIDADVGAAIAEFRRQVPEMTQLVIWGLGHAAIAAALYAHLDPFVRGLVLLNPALCAPDPGARGAARQYYLGRLGEFEFWKKVATGNLDFGASATALRHYMRAAAADTSSGLPQRFLVSLSCFEGQVLVVLGGADPAAHGFDQLARKHDIKCRRVEVSGANHTFASREWRDEVAQLCAHWMVTW
jgi:exosortase A-associated hydrolase 1